MQRTLDRKTVADHFLTQLAHFEVKDLQLLSGLAFSATYKGKAVRGVVLVSSGDYWEHRLHLPGKSSSPPELVVCYRHDSIVPCRVLALEDGKDYDKEDLPGQYVSMQVVAQEHSRWASRVMLGGLLSGNKHAHDLLAKMKESRRRRYEARMHTYQRRGRGRPLAS